MIGPIQLAVYLLIGVVVGRQFAGWILWFDNGVHSKPDADDKFWSFMGFLLATAVWPLVVIGAIWNAKSVAILPPPPHIKKQLADEEKKRLAKQVADYEERLGIGTADHVELEVRQRDR